MPRSQNGWPANDRSLIATYAVPGTDVRLALRKGDAALVLLHVAARVHREVEKLHVGWNWSYAERPIRGQTSVWSNHASGTAIDLNAPNHPLGVDETKTFSPIQIARIHTIIGDLNGAVRWGGDWKSRADAMHFEVVVSEQALHTIAARLRSPATFVLTRTLKNGARGHDVTRLQNKLGVLTDGIFGDRTAQALRIWQSRHRLSPDGVVGPKTAAKLGWTWKPNQ